MAGEPSASDKADALPSGAAEVAAPGRPGKVWTQSTQLVIITQRNVAVSTLTGRGREGGSEVFVCWLLA